MPSGKLWVCSAFGKQKDQSIFHAQLAQLCCEFSKSTLFEKPAPQKMKLGGGEHLQCANLV